MCDNGITLILDRKTGDLWTDVNGRHRTCIWNVTGLEWDDGSCNGHIKILRHGTQIGGAWNVEEIKEQW